ncbi:BA14K family protein [Aquamicrobium segne]|uniref:Lectin-like protein BA14k n=1 Tax=Aquamicrobium segne TaxID=469547 RepID=A0ABW0H3Q1_9HYPH
MKSPHFFSMKSGLAALCLAGLMSMPALAAPPPISAPAVPAASTSQDVVQIRDHRRYKPRSHRGHRHRHHHRPHYRSSGFYFGLGLGLPAYRYAEPRRYYRPTSNAHVNWCYNRYRSYRAWDNSFQPYNGPRRQCRSPYR